MHTVVLLTILASAVSAAKLGFNYGSTFTTGAAKTQSDFEAEFTTAANLKGTKGWTSARLYTMVQGGTASDPISAIPAAIKTKTSLLLGLWASAGDAAFANEILALEAAIEQYGEDLAGIVDGISIGSEDLYRNSPQGIAAGSNPGVDPDVIIKYVKQVKQVINGTPLRDALLGHVDTWTAWDNSSSSVLVDALDWIGMDAYPYFQATMPNSIGQSKPLFEDALGKTRAAARGKAVWITETGHPVSGKDSGDSVASVENAEEFWKSVGCPLFGNVNIWWYTLQDAAPDMPNPSFGIIGNELTTTPLFDLSCDDTETETESSSFTTATSTSSSSSSKGSSSSISSKPTPTDQGTLTATTETMPESTRLPEGGNSGDSGSQLSTNQPSTITSDATTFSTNSEATSGTYSSTLPSSSSSSGSSGESGTVTSDGGSITPVPLPSPIPTGPAEEAAASGLRPRSLGSSFVAIVAAILSL